MELEWETRPQQPRMHSRQQWHDQQPQPPVSFAQPTHSMIPSSPPSNYGQRRRSSAANSRPAVPPPAFPIPNLPSNPASPSASPQSPPISELSETTYAPSGQFLNHRSAPSGSFTRPSASPNLSAVAAFSQARQASSSTSQNQSSSSMGSSIDDLSDPPPQSYLPSSSRFPDRNNESHSSQTSSTQGRDRGGSLLAPPSEHSHRSENRPSSRRALTRALELAREAVQLDSTNEDPEAAVQAYAQSVALLSEVMERVRSGEDSTESHRRRRRRSVAAQEEEIRRLQNIHDTYADRMNILSIIYSIPAVPYTNPNLYSNAASGITTSPTTPSPPSDSSPQIPQQTYTHHLQEDSQSHSNGVTYQNSDNVDEVFLDESVLRSTAGISSLSSTQHPYSVQYDSGQQQPASSRMSVTYRRTRAASNLPPKAPPPAVSLPPAPPTLGEPPNTEHPASSSKRPETAPRSIDPRPVDNVLHEATRHRRNHSGLVPLQEEHDESPHAEKQPIEDVPSRRGTPRRESPPLPPLPSPPLGPDTTPRTNGRPPSSPRIANIISPRPRGTSLQTRNELTNVPYIHPPSNGSISQRRNPPSTRSSSPAESTGSVGSALYQMPPVSMMPANGPFNGRSRSSSQPGRRPSIVGAQIGSEERPPLPAAGPNGTPRKVSVPIKLNPIAPTLQIDPNHLQNNSVAFPNNPTTPVSPLPPAPPSDPLLKPYHMMHLLRTTMTSVTGGYVTRRLHVPFEVWSQGGAKLMNLDEKVRVVTVLCDALEELQNSSADCFGAGNVSSGMALGIGSIGRKEAETWLTKLEDFSNVCVGVVTSFGKKLGVGEGFVSKKATLGDKITRRLDKFTNGKNLDSPAAYVQGLKKLFLLAQLLDEHTRAVTAQPISQSYAAFPYDVRTAAEQKLKRFSEFFASVVLTFVIRDLSQLLDKYVKKCEKWLAE
ncbi:hypothetical protein CPB83DRAFT_802441 [Crepidotus variabilis]|uniref:MIT domain-containing protein n=1 Tax=Crepidotus variabilis TaxID=179855 RepID=A0A9P6ETC6_9AGAR|nr:hypothetical protein CPB83DRAFT_802441 [Crepidotus variabilis]